MADVTRTGQREVLDVVCRRSYGDESDYVEAVLEANPGLAKLGPVLPFGTAIVLPEIETVSEQPVVTLWD